ncbi:hypothetical protein HZ994_06305 [Akkermansiaceae bacterium]|nr:hypothetical protein HZ994_06305 [Akkermansiaceae bacterium]
MVQSETDAGKVRRWSGYVCPDCRFVFRVPRDHDGEGIICPSCRRMLRIPGEGDSTAPLMAPLQKIAFAESEPDPRGEKRTRSKRKKKQREAEEQGWDASSGKWRASRKKGKRTVQTVAVFAGSILAVFGCVFLLVKASEQDDGEAADIPEWGERDDFDDLVKAPLILPDAELADPVELPAVMKRSETEFLALAEPLAERFFAAKSIAEILPLVHNPEQVVEKIRAHYPGGVLEPVGISKFNSSGRVSYRSNFAAVSITTEDFEQKQLAFIEGADGLKIDWESWAGWSEMPWDEIMAQKPSKPVLVRAKLKWVDYYNFGFADESKWRSYRLTSPDGVATLYGYAERNSLLDQRLRPGEQAVTVAVMVKIRFPEDAKSANQVIIEEYVADGWVVAE